MSTALLAIFVAVIVVLVIVYKFPSSVSTSRDADMVKMNTEPASSYEQKTNHYQMTPVEMGPITGFETPFRVNMFNSYTS